MADRLDAIWKGFAQTTRARLTSTDISAHARRPMSELREERRAADRALAAGREDASDAVEAAIQALHADLQSKAGRAARRRGRGPAAAGEDADFLAPPASTLEDRLLADLKFTEARVRRSGSDYIQYADARQDAWKRRRRKFLGIF